MLVLLLLLGICCCCYFLVQDAAATKDTMYKLFIYYIQSFALNKNIYICTFKNTPLKAESGKTRALRIRRARLETNPGLGLAASCTGVVVFSNWCKDGETRETRSLATAIAKDKQKLLKK